MFLIFGLNGFLHFIPMKGEELPQGAITWMGVMMTSGWMKVLSGVQVVGGALVLSGLLLPLGLMLLCAETFNILCFHLFLTGGHGIVPGLATGMFELVVLYGYQNAFRPLFQVKTVLSL
jgi:hypothetical protein